MIELEQYIGKRKKVRIKRPFQDDVYMNGFVHDMSETLLVMHQFHDFFCEGFAIIRVSDILEFRSNEYERFFEKIMAEEGLLSQIEYEKAIPIPDLRASLYHFLKNKQNIIIECEEAEDDEFYIGKVSEIEENDVWFMGFSALGVWDKEEIAINIDKITRIQFDTPYINIFSKYVNREQ